MTTARDLLLLDVLALTKIPFSSSSTQSVTAVLDRYRVQAKPSTSLQPAQTAREALGEELINCWRMSPSKAAETKIRDSIDRYRMQLKQPNGSDKPATKTPKSVTPKDKESESGRGAKKNGVSLQGQTKKAKITEDTDPLGLPKHMEPISGGPQKRSRSRGQCPKCHSMGVVLARSYSGDEYFSCIYCGFQAYRAALDSELDLPLAAELLGRRFDEKDDAEGQE